jgi:hypothetical protein
MVGAAMKRATGLLVGVLAALAWLVPGAGASASGAGIAYVTGNATGEPVVWVADASGKHARRLGQGTGPLLSPNGLTVAVTDFGASGHALTLYPADGGAATAYFNIAQANADALAWSPDSRYLAVSLTGDNLPSLSGYGLAIIDTETGTEQMVASGVIYGASFAPGYSDTLVYARASSLSAKAGTNVFTVAANGTGRRQITRDGRSADPVWGTRGIAFDREKLRKDAPLDQIWLMAANGTHRRQITHVAVGPLVEGLVPLAFSADGTRLAAEFEGEDTSVGYSVSILTRRATQLKVGHEAVSAWGVASNGRSVLISVGGFEAPPSTAKIERIPFSGGHPTRLIAHGNYPSWNL